MELNPHDALMVDDSDYLFALGYTEVFFEEVHLAY